MDQSLFRSPTMVSIVYGDNIKAINQYVHQFMNGCKVDDRNVYQYEQFDKKWLDYTDQTTIFIEQFLPILVAFPDLSTQGMERLFKFYYSLWNSYSFVLKKQDGQQLQFKGNHFIITSLYNPDIWFPCMANRNAFLRYFPRTRFDIVHLSSGPGNIAYEPCPQIKTCDVPFLTPLPHQSLPFNFFNQFVRKTNNNNSKPPPPFTVLVASEEKPDPLYEIRVLPASTPLPPLFYNPRLPPTKTPRYILPAKRMGGGGERSVDGVSIV